MYGRTDKSVAVGLLAFACAVLAIAAWLKPAAIGYGTHMQLGLPPCNFLRLTHLPCPTCGMTTCFAWAIRLQFRKAFLANPFGILVFLGTVSLIPTGDGLALAAHFVSPRLQTTPGSTRLSMLQLRFCLLSWVFKLAEFRFAGY